MLSEITQHIKNPQPLYVAFVKSALASDYHEDLAKTVAQALKSLDALQKKTPNFVALLAQSNTDPKWVDFLGQHRLKDFNNLEALSKHLLNGHENAFPYFAKALPSADIQDAFNLTSNKYQRYFFPGDYIDSPKTLHLWAKMEEAFNTKSRIFIERFARVQADGSHTIFSFRKMLQGELLKNPSKADLISRIEENLFYRLDFHDLVSLSPLEDKDFYLNVCAKELERLVSLKEKDPKGFSSLWEPRLSMPAISNIHLQVNLDRFMLSHPNSAKPLKALFEKHLPFTCPDAHSFSTTISSLHKDNLFHYLPKLVQDNPPDLFQEALNFLDAPLRSEVEKYVLSQTNKEESLKVRKAL